ncbi:hypothetical protein RB200_19645 [Streptomyces sp. PmtG]
MIGEAIEAAITLLWALLAWVIAAAALAALCLAALTALVAWAWGAVRSRSRRPSWAHGRLRAAFLARRRTRASDGHTEPRPHPAPRKAHR